MRIDLAPSTIPFTEDAARYPAHRRQEIAFALNWRTATWMACALAMLAATAMVLATGMSVAPDSLLIMGGVIAVPGLLCLVYTRLRPDPFIGPTAGGMTAYLWGGLAVAVLSLAALGTHAPLIDARLAHADAMLGVDTPALIAWLAVHAPMQLVASFYDTTNLVVIVTIIGLGLSRRETAMWQLCFTFVGGALVCTLVSAMAPAIGTFTHYDIPAGVQALLPTGAGTYYLPEFEKYRVAGMAHIITVHDFTGVVEFPSFHAVMALMVPYGLRSLRWLKWPAMFWCVIVLTSTIPVGGHYVIDLVAGAAVWACLALLPGAVQTWPRPHRHAPRASKSGA